LRENQFVAFLGESEAAVVAAVNAAEQSAKWDGARDLSPALSETASLKELPCESFPSPVPPAEPSNRRRHTAGYSRPYIAHGSMAPSCGLAVVQRRRIDRLDPRPGRLSAAGAAGPGLRPGAGRRSRWSTPRAPGPMAKRLGRAAIDAAVIAVRRPGKPIRVLWRREDEFGHEPLGTAMHIELTAELDAGGRIADYGAEIWSGSHTAAGPLPGRKPRLALPPAPPMVPPTAAGRRAFLGGIPQRHPILRNRHPSG